MSDIVYVNVLVDSLHRKSSALQGILEYTKKQEQILAADPFDEEEFMQTISGKQRFLDRIQELDSGFEAVFNRVNAELQTGREKYAAQIQTMQKLITEIAGLGMDIEVLEQRNKVQMEKVLLARKDTIKSARANNSAVNNYYRNMANQQYNQSYFLDQKK